MWIKCLHLQLPQKPRSKCNVDDMMGFMLLEWKTNRYMQQCIFSMAGIHNRMEGKFSDEFKDIMEHARISQKFWSARGKHEKEFEFDYLPCYFFNTNDKAFPNDDPRQCGVMCGLALEYMFCPHCGYFVNNLRTMNTHVRKHYKAGLFCAHSKCNFITNHVKVMLQHGMLIHGYGKKSKNTPIKSKS